MTTTTSIAIAGGGIGGLTAALALRAEGFKVDVFEAAKQIRELGVGVNLQSYAVGELTRLGLADGLAANAMATAELAYFNKFGQRVWSAPRGLAAGLAFPHYAISRGRLQGLLLEAVRTRLGPQAIHVGYHLQSFAQNASGVVPTSSIVAVAPSSGPIGPTCWSAPMACIPRCAGRSIQTKAHPIGPDSCSGGQ